MTTEAWPKKNVTFRGAKGDDISASEVFDALVGRRSGMVREIRLVQPADGDAPLWYAAAAIADADPDPDAGEAMRLAVGGCGVDRDEATLAALCEGLERYAASCYDDDAVLKTRAELDGDSLSPAELAQFSGEQRDAGLPFEAAGDDTPLRWIEGRRLSDGLACFVPAFAVYVPYWPAAGEPHVAPSLSTGLACAVSLKAAVLAGTCEVIERDAVALTWLRGMSPPRLADDLLRECAGDVLPPRDEVAAYDLTSSLEVPVVLVVCRGTGSRGPLLSVGTACHPDVHHAVHKAAKEASQDRVYVRQLLEMEPNWQPTQDFSNLTDFSYHARLYSIRPDLAEAALAFLHGVRETGGFTSYRADATKVADYKHLGGHDGVWVDLTPEWAAGLGLHVVKVVIPALLPLHGHQRLAYLGHARLRQAESALPRAEIRHAHPLWPYPHPFA